MSCKFQVKILKQKFNYTAFYFLDWNPIYKISGNQIRETGGNKIYEVASSYQKIKDGPSKQKDPLLLQNLHDKLIKRD